MSKSPLALLAAAALIAGCVSVSGPTAAPSASATLPITTQAPGTPTPGPTASATPTAAATATAAPSATAGPTATPVPSGDLGFDQRDVLFYDDLSNPSSGWGTGNVPPTGTPVGNIAYADGTLRFTTTGDGAWMWSRRIIDSANATMRVAGEFIPTADGRFGLLCVSGNSQLYGAVAGTDGSWAFVNIGSDGAVELLADAAAGLSVPAGESTLMAIECAGVATGSLRMTLWMGKSGPVGIYESSDGPDNFDRAATFVEATGAGFSVDLDNVIAFGSGIADSQLTPDGQQLLPHVPTDWQSRCYQSLRPPFLASTAEAVLTCFLGAPGHDGAEVAEFASFLSADDMDAAYQSRVDTFGTGDAVSSCADGSGEHAYNIGGTETGRLLCVSQFRGIRFDWTDTRLNILSTLVDFDSAYGLTFADWTAGGPNP
jgi:hypothetical protein